MRDIQNLAFLFIWKHSSLLFTTKTNMYVGK